MLGKMSRALLGVRDGNTFVVMILAHCAEKALRAEAGQLPQAGPDPRSPMVPVDVEYYAALNLAAKRLGVVHLALHLFAESYPEHAARLDRASLDRLVSATMLERGDTRWRQAAGIAKTHLGIHVSPESLPREMKRTRRQQLGPARRPESH
jgi:hypothetical protein